MNDLEYLFLILRILIFIELSFLNNLKILILINITIF